MEEYESLRSFLEHVALVMDAEQNAELDAVNIMTLHSAKGLEFETVFLPGWEEGLFPHQRALDEGGRSGLEEERRLAYVGLTRAKQHLHIWFVSNRRIHGLWQSTIPSRFLDELPEAHVEVADAGNSYGGYGAGRYGGGGFASGRGGGGPLRRLALRQRPSRSPTPTPRPAGSARRQNRTEATDRQLGHALRPPGRAHRLWRDRFRLRRRPHQRQGPHHRRRTGRQIGRRHALARSTSATASSTRNSATAMSRRSRATSSPSTSTAPARRRCWTGLSARRELTHPSRCIPSRPPLSCRTSPPLGGDWLASTLALTCSLCRLAKAPRPADLPTCGEMSGRTEGATSSASVAALTPAQTAPSHPPPARHCRTPCARSPSIRPAAQVRPTACS